MVCPLEQTSRDSVSPGPIQNSEKIARGAFDPSHGSSSKGNIRSAIIRKRDLLDGTVSVWRYEDYVSTTELISLLRGSADGRILYALVWSTAEKIREIWIKDEKRRALCVIDECVMNKEGEKHPAHAHIALCERAKHDLNLNIESEEFIQVHRDLVNLMKNGENKYLVA